MDLSRTWLKQLRGTRPVVSPAHQTKTDNRRQLIESYRSGEHWFNTARLEAPALDVPVNTARVEESAQAWLAAMQIDQEKWD